MYTKRDTPKTCIKCRNMEAYDRGIYARRCKFYQQNDCIDREPMAIQIELSKEEAKCKLVEMMRQYPELEKLVSKLPEK